MPLESRKAETEQATTLAGWSVGLKPMDNGRLEVWFGRLLPGWIDPPTESFLRLTLFKNSASYLPEIGL
jgi:hypothetical protein